MELFETSASYAALKDAVILLCVDVEGLVIDGMRRELLRRKRVMREGWRVNLMGEDTIVGVWISSIPLLQVIGGGRKQVIDASLHDWLSCDNRCALSPVTLLSHMDASLKSLKVADLRLILSTAGLSAPARATKADLITRIQASPQATDAVRSLHPGLIPPDSPPLVSTPQPPTPDPPHPAPVITDAPPTDYDLERRQLRAERFGVPLQPTDPELEKRKKRAERFGIPLLETTKSKNAANVRVFFPVYHSIYLQVIQDADKLKARTDTGKKRSAPTETLDSEEQERRKKRAERFGTA